MQCASAGNKYNDDASVMVLRNSGAAGQPFRITDPGPAELIQKHKRLNDVTILGLIRREFVHLKVQYPCLGKNVV